MATSIEILQEIRRDFAGITGILLYLQNLRPPLPLYLLSQKAQGQNGGGRHFSESQTKAIDQALEVFSFVQVQYIGELRKSFGERLWYRLEDIDKPEMDKEKNQVSYGIDTKAIIETLKESARELNKKLLLLPGENGCSDEQSDRISRLIEGLTTWRIENLKQLEISFA